MTSLRAVKGMNDVLPTAIEGWRRIESAFWETTRLYRYGELRTPIVEPTELFVRSIGEVTDIVEKEMYTFTDKGEHSLTMRPVTEPSESCNVTRSPCSVTFTDSVCWRCLQCTGIMTTPIEIR